MRYCSASSPSPPPKKVFYLSFQILEVHLYGNDSRDIFWNTDFCVKQKKKSFTKNFLLQNLRKNIYIFFFDREKRSFRGPRRGSSWTWDIKSIITISLCCNDHYEITLQNAYVLCNNDFNLATLQLARNFWNFAGLLRPKYLLFRQTHLAV